MNCTLETNWQGILGIHGQFTVHLPSLGPRCQILKVGWHCLGRGVSKSHSWQPALANVSGWSWSTCFKYAHPHSEVLLQGGPKRLKLSVGYCNRPRNPVLVGKDAREEHSLQQNRVQKVEPGFWGWLFPAFTLAEWQAEVPEPSETNHPIHAWLYAWALPKWCAELGIFFCGSNRLLPVVWLRFGRHMALCNFGPSLPFTNAICKGYFCPKQWKATKKLGNSNAHPQRFWVCTRCWHTMSKFAACLMAFVFWGQLALWLGAKFWIIAYPSLLWKSLTTSNCFHLLKQHWRQLLQLTGLKNSSQRCTGHFIL